MTHFPVSLKFPERSGQDEGVVHFLLGTEAKDQVPDYSRIISVGINKNVVGPFSPVRDIEQIVSLSSLTKYILTANTVFF